jgi:hypothetical protein
MIGTRSKTVTGTFAESSTLSAASVNESIRLK